MRQVADTISELKLGNGTSILIFANIASALPTSVGAALTQAADKDASTLGIYSLAWFLTTLGIVYVQDAERQIPITYASRYRAGALQQQAYLPFKVGSAAAALGVVTCIAEPSMGLGKTRAAAGCCCRLFAGGAVVLVASAVGLSQHIRVAMLSPYLLPAALCS